MPLDTVLLTLLALNNLAGGVSTISGSLSCSQEEKKKQAEKEAEEASRRRLKNKEDYRKRHKDEKYRDNSRYIPLYTPANNNSRYIPLYTPANKRHKDKPTILLPNGLPSSSGKYSDF